jgi:hypothetical protein
LQATRTIGRFDGRKGQRLQLTAVSLDDATSLAPANPHLTVSLGGTYYENALIVTQTLWIPCGLIGVVGLLLLGIPPRRRKLVP